MSENQKDRDPNRGGRSAAQHTGTQQQDRPQTWQQSSRQSPQHNPSRKEPSNRPVEKGRSEEKDSGCGCGEPMDENSPDNKKT